MSNNHAARNDCSCFDKGDLLFTSSPSKCTLLASGQPFVRRLERDGAVIGACGAGTSVSAAVEALVAAQGLTRWYRTATRRVQVRSQNTQVKPRSLTVYEGGLGVPSARARPAIAAKACGPGP